ncbi:hypothetical protein D3C78_1450100 [compost metagenome]
MRVGDFLELFVGAAQCRQPRGIALQGDANLLCTQIRADVLHIVERFQARRGLMADERAQALMRGDQAIRAQAQQRLAHHWPRHAEALRDLVLGRQLVAHVQAARHDLFKDLPVDLVRQPHPVSPFQHMGTGCVGLLGRLRFG